MKIDVRSNTIDDATHPQLRKYLLHRFGKTTSIDISELDADGLDEFITLCEKADEADALKAIRAWAGLSTKGGAQVIPTFEASDQLIAGFLIREAHSGWIFKAGKDGHLYPWVVLSVSLRKNDRDKSLDHVALNLCAYGYRESSQDMRLITTEVTIGRANLTRRKISDALASVGVVVSNEELFEAHQAQVDEYQRSVVNKLGYQFRSCGPMEHKDGYRNSVAPEIGAKLVNDLGPGDYRPYTPEVSNLAGVDVPLPVHPVTRLFDLRTHIHKVSHVASIRPHVYDKTLRDKLVLPTTHRDLLDVLTTDLETFSSDLIEGKTAGSCILCQGVPGVGKTLSAEVYAELTERPLYSVHGGTLGVTAADIAKSLRMVFDRTKRWNAVLLLDECDVFVQARGLNIEQNAIVAEFLRTMEYFDGLMFMTTNRKNDIDDAVISRCIAIINYDPPTREDARKIWKVLGQANGIDLSDELIEEMLRLFPRIVARDIKMLLSLTLRVMVSRKVELSADLFRQVAMFRGIEIDMGTCG